MSYPNVPLQRGVDFDRRTSQTVNYLLNRESYLSLFADGSPAAGQQLLRMKLPVAITIAPSVADAGVAATANATFDLKVNGSSIGSVVYAAGQTTGTTTITAGDIPALALFEIYAPNPADATLADVSLVLAVTR